MPRKRPRKIIRRRNPAPPSRHIDFTTELDNIHRRLEHLQTADLGPEGNEIRDDVEGLLARATDAVFEVMAEIGMI